MTTEGAGADLLNGQDDAAALFFGERDLNEELGITSAEDLWRWIDSGASSPLHGGARPIPTGSDVFYRGQHDSSYSVTSSLYRLCRSQTSARVTEETLIRTEASILDAMRAEGLGRLMSDGELLMVLQHHEIPTRMIDVSEGAKEALFFAVDEQDSVAGRLHIIQVHDPTPLPLSSTDTSSLPWANASRGRHQSNGEWSDTLKVIDEQPLDPRMRAQRGKFLVGGLNRAWAGKSMRIDGTDLPGHLFADICSLNINWLRQRRDDRNSRWHATAWTLRVEADWKRPLRALLSRENPPIAQDTMYPPVDEVRRLALRVARQTASAEVAPR